MPHRRWIYIKSAHVAEAARDLGDRLAIFFFDPRGETVLIEIYDADKEWRRGKGWIESAIRVFDRDCKAAMQMIKHLEGRGLEVECMRRDYEMRRAGIGYNRETQRAAGDQGTH
jgi:hypothetical protein